MQRNAADIGETPTHGAGHPVPLEADEPADADQVLEDGRTVSLTHKQITALPFIISAPSLAEGARRAGLARSTIYRWMETTNSAPNSKGSAMRPSLSHRPR